jgi:hypothetical protein
MGACQYSGCDKSHPYNDIAGSVDADARPAGRAEMFGIAARAGGFRAVAAAGSPARRTLPAMYVDRARATSTAAETLQLKTVK